MIRINLMAVHSARPTARAGHDSTRRVTLACGAIGVTVLALTGWQVFSVRGESLRLDDQIRAADQELAAMAEVVAMRNDFESRSARLARRVALIEALRDDRTLLVRLLDQISRALPEGVWFTEFRQVDAEVTVQGRAIDLTRLSDLVTGLEASGFFAVPVEIVDSQLESHGERDVIRFELRAEFMRPES